MTHNYYRPAARVMACILAVCIISSAVADDTTPDKILSPASLAQQLEGLGFYKLPAETPASGQWATKADAEFIGQKFFAVAYFLDADVNTSAIKVYFESSKRESLVGIETAAAAQAEGASDTVQGTRYKSLSNLLAGRLLGRSVQTLTAGKAEPLPAEGWSIELSTSGSSWKAFRSDLVATAKPAPEPVIEAPQEPIKKAPEALSFKAGGTPIVIGAPISEMVEVGYDNREAMEIFVPGQNRLLAAFVLTKDLPGLTSGDENLRMARYAMVQVPRAGEYADCGVSEFKEVTDSLEEEFGSIVDATIKEAEDEFNRKMESFDLKVKLGQPTQLGCLFTKQNAYCFGMIIPVSIEGETYQMGMGATLLRVKNRLLFIYLYADYKDEETVKWLRSTSMKWTDAILAANK